MQLHLQAKHSPENRALLDDLQRIEQYVEMVLCYLRLDSDFTDYLFAKYDLDNIVRQAVRRFSSQFIHRKIRLEYEPLNCEVLTDEKWLLFVLEQVLSNALKYTPSGGTISIFLESPKTLCIRDTGIGIAAEDLPRIFEKGFTGCQRQNGQKSQRHRTVSVQAYLQKSEPHDHSAVPDRPGDHHTHRNVPGITHDRIKAAPKHSSVTKM